MTQALSPAGGVRPAPRLLLILTENATMRPSPDVGDLVEFAVAAEAAGIDGVMVSEHIVLGPSAKALGLPKNPRDYALPGNQEPWTAWPSPIVLLSAVAQATERLRLVAGAIITPLRHPLALAKELATLDRLSGGRLVVLPTVSWHADEYQALGVPFGRRGDILDEQLEVLSSVWRDSPASHEGEFYRFTDVWLEPKPARAGGPVLWFGGSSVHPRLVRRLVRYGAGFNPLGSPTDEELDRLAAALVAAGRSTEEIEYVGGTRGRFADERSVADLDEALASIPAQTARGFRTICVKPSQFIDDTRAMGDWCKVLVDKVGSLSA
jgi:probable F420-dependent oxidoreductase